MMVTVYKRAADRLGRLRVDSVRRAAIGVVVALVGLGAVTSPALAAPGNDGTSNTIQLSVTSAVLDQAHHRVIVTALGTGSLVVGSHLASAEVVTPRLTITLRDVLVESAAGTSESLSLNFTQVNINAFGRAPCVSGVDVCLMEPDGIYL
jgi:type 1 fimbria pilin